MRCMSLERPSSFTAKFENTATSPEDVFRSPATFGILTSSVRLSTACGSTIFQPFRAFFPPIARFSRRSEQFAHLQLLAVHTGRTPAILERHQAGLLPRFRR